MKIISSALGMDASSVYREVNSRELQAGAKLNGDLENERFRLRIPELETDVLRASATRKHSSLAATTVVNSAEGAHLAVAESSAIVETLVSELTGSRVRIQEFDRSGSRSPGFLSATARSTADTGISRAGQSFEVAIQQQQVRYEYASITLNAGGVVVTGDGRKIDLQLAVMMESESISRERALLNVRSASFIDPLVLSFEDGLDMLTDSTFCFDLDCDGFSEQISSLKAGSGYLALDRNGDGAINNGLELFGPRTGAGYDELRIYDEDGNNWIDENDPVFDQLQVWMGAGSSGRLKTLREAGVGALSLASADAHFNLKNGQGRVVGQISSAGLFLTAGGTVRPMSEIDLRDVNEDDTSRPVDVTDGLRDALATLQEMISWRRARLQRLLVGGLRTQEADRQSDLLSQQLWDLAAAKK